MIYRMLATVGLVALAIAGLLILSSEQSNVTPSALGRTPLTDPGYSARDATLIQTGPDGRPMYTVQSREIRQQPGSDTATLDDVVLQFRDPQGEIWTGSSDHGLIVDEGARVSLLGDVRISGKLAGRDPPARIFTDWLQVDTAAQIVSTDAPVKLLWGNQQLQARGLVARIKDQHLHLKSDVHGIYRP